MRNLLQAKLLSMELTLNSLIRKRLYRFLNQYVFPKFNVVFLFTVIVVFSYADAVNWWLSFPFFLSEGFLTISFQMYVKARLIDPTKVLVEIGTGYYVEMKSDQAKDYLKRKQEYLRKQVSSLNFLTLLAYSSLS